VRVDEVATGTSSSEIGEVSAATASSTKNATPNSNPPGSVSNSRGSTVKISPGPPVAGSNPAMEKPAGKMMKPASSAMLVSSRTTHMAALAMRSRLLR
jgi:hypothetical protein